MPTSFICDECGHESKNESSEYEHYLKTSHPTSHEQITFSKKEDEQLKKDYIKRMRDR